jgi:hypothetical protein
MTAIKGWGPKSRSSSLIMLGGLLVGETLKSSVGQIPADHQAVEWLLSLIACQFIHAFL